MSPEQSTPATGAQQQWSVVGLKDERTGDLSYGHLEEFVPLGCEVRCWGERRFLRVLRGSSFQGSRLGGPGKGVTSAAMCAHMVELRSLSRYASVAVRSRKANRLMLYTRFIRPIFALALTRPIVRTILPPILVC